MVAGVELADQCTASVLIQSLDVLVEPDVLASDCRNTL